MIIATLNLVDIGGEKYLAGEANDGIAGMEKMILVLRKKTSTTFVVHAIPVSPEDQSLRAFLSGQQSLETELVVAIRETIRPTTSKRPRRYGKKSVKKTKEKLK